MPILNTTCTYAIRAALYVASAGLSENQYVSTRTIAEDLDVSFPFLTKVLLGLTQSGILLSQRGPSGGVALARPPENIPLLDIVASAGRDGVFSECVLGLPVCSDSTPCALHWQWTIERRRLETLFAHTTLATLVAEGSAASVAALVDDAPSVRSSKPPKPSRKAPRAGAIRRKTP